MKLKPTQLRDDIALIIAEECGCTGCWDVRSDGTAITEISDEHVQKIRLRIVDLLWPPAMSTNPNGAHPKCVCGAPAIVIQDRAAYCGKHAKRAEPKRAAGGL